MFLGCDLQYLVLEDWMVTKTGERHGETPR
jgi:hypothetical protein